MSAVEDRIRQLITGDKLAGGAVTSATVTELAAMIQAPAPDSDVLAERATTLAGLDRLLAGWAPDEADNGGDPRSALMLQRRRLDEFRAGLALGLHR